MGGIRLLRHRPVETPVSRRGCNRSRSDRRRRRVRVLRASSRAPRMEDRAVPWVGCSLEDGVPSSCSVRLDRASRAWRQPSGRRLSITGRRHLRVRRRLHPVAGSGGGQSSMGRCPAGAGGRIQREDDPRSLAALRYAGDTGSPVVLLNVVDGVSLEVSEPSSEERIRGILANTRHGTFLFKRRQEVQLRAGESSRRTASRNCPPRSFASRP